MNRKIYFNGREIIYTLTPKKIKNINLRIKPDGRVVASCPMNTDYSEVDRFVRENGHKILKFQEKNLNIKNSYSISSEFADGEPFYISGEKKTICIKPSQRYLAYILNDWLIIEAPDALNIEKKKASVEVLLTEICRNEIEVALNKFKCFFNNENVKTIPHITYRKMKSRWGSCLPSKSRISINKLLACAPRHCIEYVLIHELSHLVYPDHSKCFYALVSKYVPNYKSIKQELSHYGVILSDF